MTEARPHRSSTSPKSTSLDRERYRLATHIARTLQIPMTILGLVWLVLLVVDFTNGLSPIGKDISYVIWGLFVLQFIVEFTITPRKVPYLRRNWLTAVALLVPALRLLSVFRALRALSAIRGLRLVRVVSSINRGMRSLGAIMQRRGFGYAVLLSLIVTLAGAAGMYSFERNAPGSGVTTYGSALWWTGMTLTTMGTDYFPKTAEGRLLCFLLALYGFAVFGYVTATISTFFLSRDTDTDQGKDGSQIARLTREIVALQRKIDALRPEA